MSQRKSLLIVLLLSAAFWGLAVSLAGLAWLF